MKNLSFLLILIGLLSAQVAVGQTPITPIFKATWNFNNTPPDLTGTSNYSAVIASNMTPVGVNVPTVGGYGNSPSPLGSGNYANFQRWTVTGPPCDGSEYVEFSVTLQANKDIKDFSFTELSFLANASSFGPKSLFVTSSVNGFSLNPPLYSTTVVRTPSATWDYTRSVTFGDEFKHLTGKVTFRIVACEALPTSGSTSTGTLRLDNVVINGDIVLPADIISFTARAENQQVRLDWATSWERNADRFVAEASTDLRQFRRVGEVAANGTTDQRQLYSLTDETPAPGPNYYRLAQIDRDGSVHYSKVIPAIVRPDAPALRVWPNPADRQQIMLRLPTPDTPELIVLDMLGRVVAGRVVVRSATDSISG
jgi:hypothetical protein